jgi:CheY-like chemotaxis protein
MLESERPPHVSLGALSDLPPHSISGTRPGVSRRTELERSAPASSGGASGAPAAQLGGELLAGLARLRERFREVSAVLEGLDALRGLGGEEALIEMALFTQSHEHTVEHAWQALSDCEQLARRIAGRSAEPSIAPRSSSAAPMPTDPIPPDTADLALRSSEEATPADPSEAEDGPVTQVDTAPPKVLVVDDDPTVLRAFRRVLSPDHEVVTARDGAEALHMVLGGLRIDAIICDIGMPKLDGPAFFSELFELRPQMMPRVVFCTGGQPNEKTQRFLDRLQAPLLHKPVSVADLRSAIEAVRGR